MADPCRNLNHVVSLAEIANGAAAPASAHKIDMRTRNLRKLCKVFKQEDFAADAGL